MNVEFCETAIFYNIQALRAGWFDIITDKWNITDLNA